MRLATGPIVVRAAGASDNEGMLALIRRCPMQADISLIIERDPDFFALSRARGDAHTFIAEIDGALVGCLSAWRRDAWISGRPGSVCYIGDLRVSPEYRRRGIAHQLGMAMCKFQGELPVVPYLLAMGDGNRAVAPVAATFGAVGQPIARLTSWQLLPVMRLKIAADIDIGTAEERDVLELTTLLDDFYRSRDFAPVFGAGGLHRLIAASPGARLSDYLVARRKGRIVAALGVWDAERSEAHSGGGYAAVASRTLRHRTRRISTGTAPVLSGSRYSAACALHPTCGVRVGRGPGLANLVRSAVNATRDRGEHFLLYTCVDMDTLRLAVASVPRLSFHYGITPVQFPPDAPYFTGEIRPSTWCFDDAALA